MPSPCAAGKTKGNINAQVPSVCEGKRNYLSFFSHLYMAAPKGDPACEFRSAHARTELARARAGMRTSDQRVRRMITERRLCRPGTGVYNKERDRPWISSFLSPRCVRSVLRGTAPWTSERTFPPSRVAQGNKLYSLQAFPVVDSDALRSLGQSQHVRHHNL